jgi:hypothetical protein
MKKNRIILLGVFFCLTCLLVLWKSQRTNIFRDSQIEIADLNPPAIRNLLLDVFSQDHKALCFPLNEANVGYWLETSSGKNEFELLLQKITGSSVTTTYLKGLDSRGDIKPFIQFFPPELVRFGWSDKTRRTSSDFKDYGVYIFYDEKTEKLLLIVFK